MSDAAKSFIAFAISPFTSSSDTPLLSSAPVFAREDILAGKINKVMIIGKGSLFLGRMTNLFDGVSFVIQANTGAEETVVYQKKK